MRKYPKILNNIAMKYIYFIIFLFFGILANSQKTISISGKVVENNNKLPIEFATVLIADKTTKKPITGVTTDEKGLFQFTSKHKNFYIEVSFIGFKTKLITQYKIENNQLNLGTIVLLDDAKSLEEVVIRAEKSQTVFKLDKRIFNVGKDLSTSGVSALEVLNNVPSVNVNIEGVVSLRGSEGVQILINGKPSITTENALGTITAEMIDRVEVITNPSAKYDAEGTSGIINIVMKKSKKKGLNGSVTLNTGIPNNHSIGLSVNRRTEKFNLFSQIGYGFRTLPIEFDSFNINHAKGTQLYSIGDSAKDETFFNIVLGTDYHINDLNVLTLSGHYALENELETSHQIYVFNSSDKWSREEESTAINPKWEYELQYKKDFKDQKNRDLIFSATGKSFQKDKASDFKNTTLEGDFEDTRQRSKADYSLVHYTFKLDYTHPIDENYTIETGAQYLLNRVSNDYSVDNFIDESWINNTNYTNVFDYNQGVIGLYSTASYEDDTWGLKLGLRYENTDLRTELKNTKETNNQRYSDFFPSTHASYKISDKWSLQAGYSKRISRPRLWSLNPFSSFRDNYNLRTGNPHLKPEYTDSFELTSIYKIKKTALSFGVYQRYTTDVSERVLIMDSQGVVISTPQNIGTNSVSGVEFNTKYRPIKWMTLITDVNYQTYTRHGSFEEESFDFTSQRWSAKLVGKFKLPSKIRLELTGRYRSKNKTTQYIMDENLYMDFAMRKKIMNGKLTATLAVRDVFSSRTHHAIADQITFYKKSNFQRGRFVTFGVSFGFGKGEAMAFSYKTHH